MELQLIKQYDQFDARSAWSKLYEVIFVCFCQKLYMGSHFVRVEAADLYNFTEN